LRFVKVVAGLAFYKNKSPLNCNIFINEISKKENKMKRIFIILIIIAFAVSMMLVGIGCKEEAAEDITEEAMEEEAVEEEAVEEEAVEEEAVEEEGAEENIFSDITIKYFAGGSPGETFSESLHSGAMDAAEQLGVNVDFIFSEWTNDMMIQQLREAIAANPDGIAMMGHPGPDAIMSLAEQAYNDEILMTYHNVDVPDVREKFGGGYVGAQLWTWGENTGKKAVEMFDIGEGDRVVLYGVWDMPGRLDLEEAAAQYFESVGATVDRITITGDQKMSSELFLPTFIADLEANPDTKAILLGVMTHCENSPAYLEAAGKAPGEIPVIVFNNSPKMMDGFASGYIQLSGEQQPYMQGYLPIISLAYKAAYGFDYISHDTGGGFITKDNYEEVGKWVQAGVR